MERGWQDFIADDIIMNMTISGDDDDNDDIKAFHVLLQDLLFDSSHCCRFLYKLAGGRTTCRMTAIHKSFRPSPQGSAC